MNKDLIRFNRITNPLVFLTTKDEYGTSRSRGVETLSDLAEELNREGISAPRGHWTENSLKLYIHRLKGRYTLDMLAEECDLDFIEASAWEYTSYTHHEEVIHKGKSVGVWQTGNVTQSYPMVSYKSEDNEKWKLHEVQEVISEDIKIMIKSNNIFRQ